MRLPQLLSRTRLAGRPVAFGIALGACVAIAALSGSASAATGQIAAASKTQLIAKADAICLRVNTKTAPYQSEVNRLVSAKHPNYKRMAAALNKGVTIEQTGLNQLRALPVPAADRDAVTKIWNQLGAIISASQDMTSAVADGNISAVNQATQRKAGAETVYHRLAASFGFQYCGAG